VQRPGTRRLGIGSVRANPYEEGANRDGAFRLRRTFSSSPVRVNVKAPLSEMTSPKRVSSD